MVPDDKRDSGSDLPNGGVVIPFPGGQPGVRPPDARRRRAGPDVEAHLQRLLLPKLPQKYLGEAWYGQGYSLAQQYFGPEFDTREAHVALALNEAGREVYHVYIHKDVFNVRGRKEREKCEKCLGNLGNLLPKGKVILVLSEGHEVWPIDFERVLRYWERELGLTVRFYPWSYVIALGQARKRAKAIRRLVEITGSARQGVRDVTSPSGNQVFICYSRTDEEWLDRLLEHLSPLARAQIAEPWSDRNIGYGRWFDKLVKAIESARVAVLLVSKSFLASDFINKEEIPRLLAQEQQKGTIILPVIVTPSWFEHIDSLAQFQSEEPLGRQIDLFTLHIRCPGEPRAMETVVHHSCFRVMPHGRTSPTERRGGRGLARHRQR
jgi:TIR domain